MATPRAHDEDPHRGRPVLRAGVEPAHARAAMVLAHGRGASARDILSLAAEVDPGGFAYVAPQAAGSSWYPHSFLAPISTNEPWLSSALGVIGRLTAELEVGGIPAERLVLLGFSQGACLALEFAARNARRWGAVIGLSGGLIGPPRTPRRHSGDLAGTPVFLGCSNRDPHIPVERVRESAAVLRELGGRVTERLYPGLGHTVNADELRRVAALLRPLASPGSGAG